MYGIIEKEMEIIRGSVRQAHDASVYFVYVKYNLRF